jgi:NAD(P)-dependent dehydrogenase (short-subunit alcohol dehydrogenase family)
MNPFDLSGRAAVVTGGNGGVGLSWGEPEEFEAVTVLLAGSGSQYITGAAIPVDGGYSIQA